MDSIRSSVEPKPFITIDFNCTPSSFHLQRLLYAVGPVHHVRNDRHVHVAVGRRMTGTGDDLRHAFQWARWPD